MLGMSVKLSVSTGIIRIGFCFYIMGFGSFVCITQNKVFKSSVLFSHTFLNS